MFTRQLITGTLGALALVAGLTVPVRLAAAGPHVRPEHLAGLGKVIRSFGYACPAALAGVAYGQSPHGLEFKVLCESGTFQVIVTPNDDFRVQTWATRLR
jgi:hypothetical protein